MEGLLVMAELFADVEFKSPPAEMPEHSNEGKLGDFMCRNHTAECYLDLGNLDSTPSES